MKRTRVIKVESICSLYRWNSRLRLTLMNIMLKKVTFKPNMTNPREIARKETSLKKEVKYLERIISTILEKRKKEIKKVCISIIKTRHRFRSIPDFWRMSKLCHDSSESRNTIISRNYSVTETRVFLFLGYENYAFFF